MQAQGAPRQRCGAGHDHGDDDARRSSESGAEPPPSDDAGGRPERDFGDSAGYGTGGSALDYHEVGDEDASPIKGRRNPLDDVMNPVPPPADRD